MGKILEEKRFMINKKIMVLALILVSLMTISCVSAAEDGNDVLNTISVDGIDDEQVAEASVDDAGNDMYNTSSASVDFVFEGINTTIDCNYDENYEMLYITLLDNTNLPVKYADLVINFNGKTYNRITNDYGCVEFYVGGFASGTYPVNVSYAGNATYNPAFTSYDIVIGREGSILYCDYYADDRKLAITLTDPYAQAIVRANVMVNLGGGVNYNLVTDYNGMAIISIPDLAPGPYTANVYYEGSNYYDPAFTSYDFNVPKFDTDMSLVYSNDELVATLLNNVTGIPIKGASVVFKFNDVSATVKTDVNGQAKYYYVEGGSYTATASYKGNTKYNPSTASVEFTIKISTSIFLVYNNGAREVVATLIDDATGQFIKNSNVSFEVNGVKSTVKTDANGQAKVSVADLALGNYRVTANYLGNSKYYPSSVTVDFTITKIMTTISQYYDEATQELVATLINSETGQAIKGATIVFNYNGVKTAAKTDKLGQARLHIGEPVVESASLSYGGNSKYLKSYASIKFATDKISTVISNFYYKETQEVVATLINRETGQAIKGATVVFNFNGMKTALKTDKFGQVKLSVEDLVPDEYYISSSYGGNTKYAGSVARISFVKI
ncbi:Ig-like domain repeat protein [Methanobrevibacter sp.]|uniref:Ig-like domain repeat protein n=1 Tax=Methanobrevibacter sp. TaxID=66852 RepID=UPI0025F45B1A|nr:Ig-like domain repeat protein [Methanobrevibacter sp.]MBQ6511970.1 Ig-like domain repeat protein [Methanobrevibacter sp.]